MNRLVLDKNIVWGSSIDTLLGIRRSFDFLIPEVLPYEIWSEDIAEWDKLGKSEKIQLFTRISDNYDKLRNGVGDCWIELRHALKWEIEKGTSAKQMPGNPLPDIPPFSKMPERIRELSLDYEKKIANLFLVNNDLELDQQLLQELRKFHGESNVFDWLEEATSCGRVFSKVCEGFKRICLTRAESEGWEVSSRFRPTRDWLSFGMAIGYCAGRAIFLWRHRDAKSIPRQPQNDVFDSWYVAHIAIADGILSKDEKLLKLAWALWPEKRDNIYNYDQSKHEPRLFVPEGKSYSGFPLSRE